MAFKLSGDAKKIVDRGAQQNSAAPVSKPAPVQKSQASVTGGNPNTQPVAKPSTGGFKLNSQSKALVDNANRFTVQGPKTFQFAGNYYSEDGAGNYIKNSYIKKQSDRDKKKVEETGHETLGTDIGQATKAGLKGWVAPQLSTLATVPLAITAAVHGDNHYEPQAGGGLWKMLNASHAENQEAARLREASTEGRGTVGSTLLEGYSSAVTNGIDTALSLIPYVGPTLTKVSFASRSFGGAAQSARDQGKSVGTQVLNGAISAAIEHVTENLWTYGGVRDLSGSVLDNTGPLGNLTNKLEVGLAKKAGPIVSRLAMTFGTEAVEEMMADVLNPIVGLAVENTLGKTKLFNDYEGEEWQGIGNMLHDGVIGGIAGILGGVSSAAEAIGQFNKAGGTNQLYATALRQEFEQKRDAARADSAAARDIHRAALGGVLDSLFNKKTGRTVSERVSEATGRYVSRKDAFKMVGEIDSDFPAICRQVAHEFAEKNFANEVVNKEALEEGVYKLLVKGEFADELNSIEDARTQIQQLTKEIMTSVAEQKLAEAKGKKNKAQTAFYTSLLSQLVGQNIGENQAESANVDNITEARTYGYTAEELAADQAAREAELHPEQERPAYVARQEQAQQTQQAQQQENWVMRGDTNIYDPRNQAYIQKNNPELWAEYQKAKGMSGDAGIDAMRDVTAKMKTYLAEVNKDSNVSWQTESEPVAEQQAEVEADNGQENTISKADQKKLDKIFTKLGTSIRIKTDETALRDAVYARAEAENVDVVEGKYGDRITLSIREKATGNPIIDNQRETKANKNAAEEESVEKLTPEQAEAEADVWLDEAVAVVDDVLSENTDERKQQISELRDKIKSDLENGKNPLYFSTKSQETSGEANSEEIASTAEQADVADKAEANNKQEQISEVEKQNRIDSFSGEYDFLNNNYKSDIYFSKFDKTFPSVKAALANKQVSAEYTERDVVKKKFEQNTELRDKLFATGDAVIDNGSELSTILTDLRTELQDIDSPYNNRLRYLEASKSGSFANELQSLKNIESEDKALAEQKKESLLSKFRGEKKNGSDTSSTGDATRDDGLGDIRPRRPRVSAEAQSYAGRYPEWTNRRGNESGNQENQVTERRTFGKEGQAVLEGDKGKLLKNGMWVFGYHGYRILSPITGSVGDYINRLAEHFGNKDSTILVGGEGGMTVVGNWKASHKGVSTANEIAISLSGDNAKQGINTFVHEETHQKLMHDNRYGDSTDTNQIYQKAVRVESIARGACKTAGLSNLAFKRILATYYLGAYQNTFKADGTYDEFKAYCKKNGLNLEDTLYSLCAEEFLCDITGDTANLRKVINWLSETDTQITEADLAAIRKATLEELQNQGVYSAEDVAVINDAVAASASGDFVGLSSEYGDTSKMFETVYEAYNPTSKSASGRTSASEEIEIPTLNEFRAERGEVSKASPATLQTEANKNELDTRETTEEPYSEIQNKKGTFRDDVAYAVTSGTQGTVSKEDLAPNIAKRKRSAFKLNGYNVYIAYSQGERNRLDDKGRANIQGQDSTEQTYTAEVYDKNKLVCRTSISGKLGGHEQAVDALSDRLASAIGAYENGELKAVIPAPNGIGTKAQFKSALDKLIGWSKAGDYNSFKNGDSTSETFEVGNYNIELSSTIAEDGEPRRGDVYKYRITDSNGKFIDDGEWAMGSDYSPSWIIAEKIHNYAIDNGERMGVNDSVGKDGNVVTKTFNRVKTTGNTATSATAESQLETNRIMQEREERNQDYAERESAAMSDEELWQARRADLDTPTRQDFERSKEEQPKATRGMSPAEANEMAERSFGKKGRIRATRAVENFNRIKNPFSGMEEGNGTNLEAIRARMGDMQKALINVNDGYGTVKDVADVYKTWRDNKLMSDYYDEDIAARFDKILEDAEAKGWTFEAQDQREFAQAYEEACNAMTAKINNVNKSADRLSRLKTEAIANKLNIKSDGLISKTIQRFIRMQITTDTAMKLFGGFKGSGEFYQLGKDIKDGVAKRMIKYVDAYSHFDNLKKMEGFKEFSQNTKKYQLEFNNEFNDEGVGLDNPLKGVDLSLQQIVTISRLIKTLDKTFEHSDAKAADRVKGFVIRDSNGNSKTIDLDLGDTTDTGEAVKASGKMTAIKLACDRILNQDGAVFEVARAYDKACDAMFKSMGKDVSAVKKALTGNALSLIGEDYTPVLWANDDGSPAEFNFNDDDRLRPPAFLYNRTAKQGNLVVSDISYIVDKYIEKAADYIGTAEIKDTLSRLNDGTSLLDKGKGLNSSLAENFGKDAGTWFDEYVKDLTQYGENDSIWSALRRNMQKGALIGSPSVMMKQTSSYWSAMGLLSPEALAMAYRWKVGVKAADNSEYNKLLKYRHISDNIDPTLTEIIKGVDKYGKASNSRVFQLFTNGISEQDFKTVDNLYTATMIDTYLKNQNKSAEYFTSGEFQNDIDSKFTEVMMRSQPMFDTELRAEYARTDNELVKMTSMFRTQQTQNLNLIATAIGEYNASKGTGEQSEKLKVLQQTVAGQASAALSLALLSVAADFMLHGLKKYRGDGDDDDEEPGDGKIELGRILGRIGLNTVEAGAGTVWFGDSVAKWLIDRMSGGETNEFYGLNMGPITTFKNVLDNLEYVAKSPTPSNIKNVATNISQLMGIPLNNAYRIVNSAVMYVEDVAGVNDKNYDDMLKQVTNRTKVNEKNVAGRNLLVESGMTKREATAFVKTVDVDDNGLNKEDLQNYYIEHPEDAERVSILWDSMGWKTKFEKEKKNLDKKVVYNSNPLYAEMDEDESGSVTKTEMMDYALEHEDQIDELSALYKEQGFKGSFRSALKSAENSKLKEQAEDAFYEGDYNVLFDTVSQMKNGKSYLTNLIKDEYDEYDNVSNPLVRYMIDAKRPVKEIDEAVEAYGAKKFIPQYKALRATGLSPSAAIQKLDNFDANANGSITQAELADYYKAHKDEEAMIAEFWKACGWSTTWSKYKKRKKLK